MPIVIVLRGGWGSRRREREPFEGEGMDVEQCSGSIITIPFGHHKIDALYYFPLTHEGPAEKTLCILRLHGILGNLLDETEHALPHHLAKEGYSSLTMNTLLANLGLFFGFGIFDDAMPQIDAACDFLRKVGFKNIVIAGHGLGGSMAIRYASLRGEDSQQSGIRGVIAIATSYSMPETVRRRWDRFGSEPTYDEMYRRAIGIFHAEPGSDPAGDETVVVKRAHGHTTLPEHTEVYTLKTWWALASPEVEGPKTYLHIGKVPVPILLVHGMHDDIIEPREGEDLGVLAGMAGNKDVTQIYLDAPHSFEGKQNELGQAVVNWLCERF